MELLNKDKVVEVNADISYNGVWKILQLLMRLAILLHVTNLKNSDSPECDLTALNNDSQIEKEADIFAACILMPEDLVKGILSDTKIPTFFKGWLFIAAIGKKIKQSALLICFNGY